MNNGLNVSDATFATFVGLMRHRAQSRGDQLAISFLRDGETEQLPKTYGQIDREARAIAYSLREELKLAPGDRAILAYPAGLEFVSALLGCMYAGVVAVPAPLPRPRRPICRMQSLVEDCGPRVILTTAQELERLGEHTTENSEVPWAATDSVEMAGANGFEPVKANPNDLAVLQYTSGSTASPKGVMLTHRNLLSNCRAIYEAFGHGPQSRGVVWSPPYHDMGLIGGILQPIYGGFPVLLMSPVHVVQQPCRWLHAVSQFRATTSGGPNFMYELCLDRVTDEDLHLLDLSCWRVAFNGAEPVRAETLERFAQVFGPCGFRSSAFLPCYGLAESTLLVTGHESADEPRLLSADRTALESGRAKFEDSPPEQSPQARQLVSCGTPLADSQVRVVDPSSRMPVAAGRIGEIWVSGPSVSQGYWNQPEISQEIIQATLAMYDGARYLRTGDLGFLHDGQLYVTGRIKDLVIVSGRNLYPQDIERTVATAHGALQPEAGAAFSLDTSRGEQLVVVHELRRQSRQANADEVIRSIRAAVTEDHEVSVSAVVLLKASGIPRTTSGKIQRSRCAALLQAGELPIVASWQNGQLDLPGVGQQEPAAATTSDAQADENTPATSAALPRCQKPALEIRNWLIDRLARQLHCAADAVDPREPFTRYGLSSIDAMQLAGDLENYLDLRLPPTLVYDCPTIDALAARLGAGELPRHVPTVAQTQPAAERDAIAIVGMSCRFPGADNLQEFWQMLESGRDAVGEVPAERWNWKDYSPGARWGGFLREVDQFDPAFFGISPREAATIDPQHRKLLEVAWEALEDAGEVPRELRGSRTGVFLGISTNDYSRLLPDDVSVLDPYWCTGNSNSLAANRLSYFFDFRGPSLAIDTACSSSLVAIFQACAALERGEADLALAGGANLILSPAISLGFEKGGALASDGRCKAFDARANGMCRSEGIGVLVLKRLRDALADGDPVYALIRGGAVNQDGRTNGITAPLQEAQEAVLRDAYRHAGISPADLQYIETHGAGTLLGDVIEAKALGTVLAPKREGESSNACRIGSLKSNIGHCEAAAGVGGVIKVALSLLHGKLPPSLHFHEPNPHIPFEELRLAVQTELGPWPESETAHLAGVSGFGFGGTNAHLVLQSFDSTNAAIRRPTLLPTEEKDSKSELPTPLVLPLSAPTAEALTAQAQAWHSWIDSEPRDIEQIQSACSIAARHRQHFDRRTALWFRSGEQLERQLEFLAAGQLPDQGAASGVRSATGSAPLVFVFSGHGGSWWGMGRHLLAHFPEFRRRIDQCDAALRDHAEWSLWDVLGKDESESPLAGASLEMVQTSLFAFQVALADVWQSLGIRPQAVVGHSMGEVAAACVAGALPLADALHVMIERSRLLDQAARESADSGAMAAVRLDAAQTRRHLGDLAQRVHVAVHNSPQYTVLSGDVEAIDELIARWRKQKIVARKMNVPGAAHTPALEPVRQKLATRLAGLEPQATDIAFFSTVTGERIDSQALGAAYWGRNVRMPVLFAEAIESLLATGHENFLEIGPHPLLAAAIAQCAQGRATTSQSNDVLTPPGVIASLRRDDEPNAWTEAVATLYARGYDPAWQRLVESPRQWVSIPSYAWQHRRCWLDQVVPQIAASNKARLPQPSTADVHPLLLHRLESASRPGVHVWETTLTPDSAEWLNDHQVEGQAILPAAAVLDAVLTAAKQLDQNQVDLHNVEFVQAIPLHSERPRKLQLEIECRDGVPLAFTLFGKETSATEWQIHARGEWRQADAASLPEKQLADVHECCTEAIDVAAMYEHCARHGGQYGPAFRGLQMALSACRKNVSHDTWEAVGQIAPAAHAEWQGELLPPWLDACLHTLIAAAFAQDVAGLYLPHKLGRLQVLAPLPEGEPCWSHAQLTQATEEGVAHGQVTIYDDSGNLLVAISDLRLQRCAAPASPRVTETEKYELAWQPAEPVEFDAATLPETAPWLILADDARQAEQVIAALDEAALAGATLTQVVLATPKHAGEEVRSPACLHVRFDPSQSEEWARLFTRLERLQRLPRTIVQLWSGKVPGSPMADDLDLPDRCERLCTWTLHNVQNCLGMSGPLPRLVVVTQGVERDAIAVQQKLPHLNGLRGSTHSLVMSPLWGMICTLQNEHPELKAKLIDLDLVAPADDSQRKFLAELVSTDREEQVALYGGKRFVARLVRSSEVELTDTQERGQLRSPDEASNFELKTDRSGMLERLHLAECTIAEPDEDEVLIEVAAAGLNFHDVLTALGLRPETADAPQWMGAECAGRVIAVGCNVQHVAVGDEVMAVVPGAFARVVKTHADLVARNPRNLHLHQAATLPITFLTAIHSLETLGQLGRGQRVLIHAAAGGVGQAAVQIAKRLGAEVFATAGTAEKRRFLRLQGVQHVFDSRSLDFAEGVLAATSGQGVDVVLNSLAGEAMIRSLDLLRPFGRFVEIGRRVLAENVHLGLKPFERSLSYFAVDMGRLVIDRPEHCGMLLRKLAVDVEENSLAALPLTTFRADQAEQAFRYMAAARHTGKVLLDFDRTAPASIRAAAGDEVVRAEATYLISGGLRGLGLRSAQWLVEQGARHLVLLGRSAPSRESLEALEMLSAAGANVRVERVDVTDRAALEKLLARVRRDMPPIRGVLHAAAVLEDAALSQMNAEQLARVLGPKIRGAWNLHSLTQGDALDWFVGFSSLASLLGSPGQANYAAGNAFIDHLAVHRARQGWNGLAINWGPWGEVGGVAQAGLAAQLEQRGFELIQPDAGLKALETSLARDAVRVAVASVDWQRVQAANIAATRSPLLAELLGEAQPAATASSPWRHKLQSAEPAERAQLLEEYLRTQLAATLGTRPESLDAHQPLLQLGIDSLMAMELRNRVQAELGIEIRMIDLLENPTLAGLTSRLAGQWSTTPTDVSTADDSSTEEQEQPDADAVNRQNGTPLEPSGETISEQDAAQLLERLDELPPDQVDLLLQQMLADKESPA